MDRYESIEYLMDEEGTNSWKGKVAGIAACKIIGGFDKILVFYTSETEQWIEEYRKICLDNELPNPVFKKIPSGNDSREQMQVVDTVIDSVLEITHGVESAFLTIDITPGYRLLPLLYFAGVSFLTSFHKSTLEKVIYSEVNRKEKTGTIRDVTSSFEVIEWYHAALTFAKTDNVEGLLALVERRRDELRLAGEDFKDIDNIRKGLCGLSGYSTAALPLELGIRSYSVKKLLDSVKESPSSLPLFKHLFDAVREIVNNCTIDFATKKVSIPLTLDEIKRQKYIIQRALDHGHITNALTMLRETFLNAALLEFNPANWLSRQSFRQVVTQRLGALARRSTDSYLAKNLSMQEIQIGKLWDQLTQARNKVAHCGYSNDTIDINDLNSKAFEILQGLEKLDFSNIWISQDSGCKLLVSPLGRSKGALFSALRHISPDSVLVLTSRETSPTLKEVLRNAGFPFEKSKREELDNPYTGFDERQTISTKWREFLSAHQEVFVNVVGGTTLMGEIARTIGREAIGLGIPTTVFACVDSRDYESQQREPYVVGEYVEIERWPDSIGAEEDEENHD